MATGWTHAARGQGRGVPGDNVYAAGTKANIFLDIDDDAYFEGGSLRLPSEWKLEQAMLVRRGGQLGISWSQEGLGEYALSVSDPRRRSNQLVVQVSVPELESAGELVFVPRLTRSDGSDHAGGRPRVIELVSEARRLSQSNRAGQFDARTRLELEIGDLPLYRGDGSFTLEFWIKTVGLNQIVMSSWDGSEESSYPAEVVIAPDGRLLYFRGEPGYHVAMSSGDPVADGRWHHVAVSHNGASGLSRLLVDAAPTDSLLGTERFTYAVGRFCIGGRCVVNGNTRTVGFAGQLDDLRIWSTSRTKSQIRSAMADHLRSDERLIAISFDDDSVTPGLVGYDKIARPPSDFLYFDGIDDLAVSRVADGVEVHWRSGGRATEYFSVERADDGATFFEQQRYAPNESADGRFVFRDERLGAGVAFYRIRQHLENGGVRYSPTLKVGMGEENLPDAVAAVLLGNFPNPFSVATTISFDVPEPQHVQVSIWDLSGQEIVSLVDATVAAGRHDVTFTPGDLPSGAYFARLQTPSAVITRKVILAR